MQSVLYSYNKSLKPLLSEWSSSFRQSEYGAPSFVVCTCSIDKIGTTLGGKLNDPLVSNVYSSGSEMYAESCIQYFGNDFCCRDLWLVSDRIMAVINIKNVTNIKSKMRCWHSKPVIPVKKLNHPYVLSDWLNAIIIERESLDPLVLVIFLFISSGLNSDV